MGILERLGVAVPVVQAGMGGGISGAALAAAVSEASGLETIDTMPPTSLERELERAQALTSQPIAVNMLLPFTHSAH